jgi:[acyl-carrier-protein] S-malonyltransferase
MKVSFVYPGQGSQVVGMGKDFYDNFSVAKLVMEEVQDVLKQDLKTLIFEGPIDQLTLTENAQPALLTVSMMIQKVLEDESGKKIHDLASCVAGHSLGEYSALCASGFFSLSDATLLVKIRGNAMQQSVPVGVGAMAAILGIDMDILDNICKDFQDNNNLCVIANDNALGQIVISGHKKAVDSVSAIALEKGAKKSVLLPVSAPFHSPLMADAANVMEQAIDSVAINQGKLPVIANVLAEIVYDPLAIKNLLVTQITGRVRWRESVDYLTNNNYQKVIEIGSGKVLTNLVKRINPNLEALSINKIQDLESILQNL